MRVIATAGHVDHGKSTLVRALTGINPDRLREEQQREMTLDLGFAWMTLADGESVGVIDVPGHIDFIDNMLAGVGGIDAALLVIAADEGAMPQTREHLDILKLLQIQRAVIALTKCDLVDDEWMTLIGDDIRRLIADSPIANSKIVPVSARANLGLEELKRELARVLSEAPPRRDLGRPRLSVDRVFTLQGFGTVVTGTLVDGVFVVGDEVEIVTQKGEIIPSRVRGLQTHKQKLERAQPGSRVAINLTGVTVDQLARGCVVTKPGALKPTTMIDVRLELIDTALRHNTEVKIFCGAAQNTARVWLLDGNEIGANQNGWAQLQLASPMALMSGDRFIVRLPSPSMTIGGGTVIDAYPTRRYRRRGGKADDATLSRLQTLSEGSPSERVADALAELRFALRDEAMKRAQLERDEFDLAISELIEQEIVVVSNGILALESAWRNAHTHAQKLLSAFHSAQPLQQGMSRESLRSRLQLSPKVFDALLKNPMGLEDTTNVLVDEGETVRLASHEVKFNVAQQQAVDALLKQMRAQPWNTPLVKDCKAALGEDVFETLLRQKKLTVLNNEVVLLEETYRHATQHVREEIQKNGSITAAQARDLFGTTRKYSLALLEHLDEIGVTKRVGDARVLR
jgi:selenocysteine-specific elongation factor